MPAVTAWSGEQLKSGSGILAASDLGTPTSYQYYAVVLNSASQAVVVSSQGQGGIKILGNKPGVGDPCFLIDIGETKCIAGAAITVGQILMTNSSGQLIPWVNNGVNVPVAEARMAATNAGDFFTAFIFPSGVVGLQTSIQNGLTALSGGGRPGATQLAVGWNEVSTATSGGTDSVVLPAAEPGQEVFLVNDAGYAIQVFGAGSDMIDATAGATGVSVATLRHTIFRCLVAGQWWSVFSLAV